MERWSIPTFGAKTDAWRRGCHSSPVLGANPKLRLTRTPTTLSRSRPRGDPIDVSGSRCITSKDKVGRFGLLVAREAAFHKRRVARFAVLEVSEAPSASCRVLC